MSEMNPIEREQKKKQLRGRVIDTATQNMFPRRGISHGENEGEVAEKAERHSRRKRLRMVADGGVNRGAFGGWFYVL